MIELYRLLTFILVLILPFFLGQFDSRIIYLIGIFAILLLPIFLKEIKSYFKSVDNCDDRNLFQRVYLLAKKDAVAFFFILFLAVSLLSTVFSTNIQESASQMLLFLSYFVIYISMGPVFFEVKDKERLAILLVYVSIVLSAISLYNTLILRHFVKGKGLLNFMSVYYGHNHLSALLLFSIPLCFYFIKMNYSRNNYLHLFLRLTFVFLLVSLFFTFGIGSILALTLAGIVALFLFKGAGVFKNKVFVGLVVGIVIVIALFGISVLPKKLGFKKIPISSIEGRISYWQQSLYLFSKRPLVGTGLNTYKGVAPKTKYRKKPLVSYQTMNFFLQMLAETGILGFIASVSFIFSIIITSYKRVQKYLNNNKKGLFLMMCWIGILASTFNAMVDFDWQLPTVFFIFWIIMGIVNSKGENSRSIVKN